MSGPKCGGYDATEARLRREREAARRALESALADVRHFNAVERAAARSAYRVDVASLQVDDRRSGTTDELRWRTQAAAAALAARRADMAGQCRLAREQSLTGLFASWEASSAAERVRSADQEVFLDEGRWRDRIRRALETLPADATAEEVERATSYATLARDALDNATTPAETVRSLVTALGRVADEAARASEHRQAAVAAALALRQAVLEVELDPEGDDLLGRLDAVIRSGGSRPLAPGTDSLVAGYVDRARRREAEADRLLVLEAARAALVEIGFDLGEQPSELSVVDWLAIEPEADTALRVRERDGELYFNLIRVDNGSPAALTDEAIAARDAAAETSWCSAFDAMTTALRDRGVTLDLRSRRPVGERPLHIMTLDEIGDELGADARARVAGAQARTSAPGADEQRFIEEHASPQQRRQR